MGILTWIVVGLLIGILSKWFVPATNPGGMWVLILLGIVGAVVGGMIGTSFGFRGVNSFDIRSLMVAGIASLLVLLCFRIMAERAASA